MSCYSCKNKNTSIEVSNENKSNFFLRLLYFIIGVLVLIIITPIIVLIGMYMLFNTIVLDKSTEIMPSISLISELISKLKKPSHEEDEEFDDEEFDEDNYELIGVEEVIKKNNV